MVIRHSGRTDYRSRYRWKLERLGKFLKAELQLADSTMFAKAVRSRRRKKGRRSRRFRKRVGTDNSTNPGVCVQTLLDLLR